MAVINAVRTVKNFRKTNRVNPYFDMRMCNVNELFENSDDFGEAIYNSFVFGYIQGLKAARKEAESK